MGAIIDTTRKLNLWALAAELVPNAYRVGRKRNVSKIGHGLLEISVSCRWPNLSQAFKFACLGCNARLSGPDRHGDFPSKCRSATILAITCSFVLAAHNANKWNTNGQIFVEFIYFLNVILAFLLHFCVVTKI